MTKKNYQAIAGALYAVRVKDPAPSVMLAPSDQADKASRRAQWRECVSAVAGVLANDNPRFEVSRFLEACETGKCKGMRRAS
jgi:hypothetical protein